MSWEEDFRNRYPCPCGKPLQGFRGGGVEPHMGQSPTARISYNPLIAPLLAPVQNN